MNPSLFKKISGKTPSEVARIVQRYIFDKKCKRLEPYDSYSLRLTEAERHIIHCYVFVAETNNGGTNQFICNLSGDYTEDAIRAFDAIGAKYALEALNKIKNEIYGGLAVPKDRKQRCEVLFSWEEKDEKHSSEFFTHIDKGLRNEGVDEAAGRYILSHLEQFP